MILRPYYFCYHGFDDHWTCRFVYMCWILMNNFSSIWPALQWTRIIIVITRDSEVIMFSPCVFVCVCVVVYVCQDVCPGDLIMKDWCHTNNILQVHCWGCLVVQVMFRTLMTSLMMSQDHKVGQILKLIYLLQYLSYSVDQQLKMSEMLMAIFLVYSTSGITSGKKVCRQLKMAAILKILKY